MHPKLASFFQQNALVLLRVCKLALQMGVGAVLARILSPIEFGLFAMAAIVYSGLFSIRDFGLTRGLIPAKKSEVPPSLLSAAFWGTLAWGCVLGALCYALAPAAAWVFQHAELKGALHILALSFPVMGATVAARVGLLREGRFLLHAGCELFGLCFGLGISLGFAWQGWGLAALCWGAVASVYAGSAAVWFFAPSVPLKTKPNFALLRQQLPRGRSSAVLDFADWLLRHADVALLSTLGSPAFVGLYTKAFRLAALPKDVLCDPLRERWLKHLTRTQVWAAVRGRYAWVLPLCLLLVFCSEEIVWLLFGKQWLYAAQLLKPLLLFGLAHPVHAIWHAVGLQHTPKTLMRWEGAWSAALLTAMAVGLHYLGAYGVVWALAIGSVLRGLSAARRLQLYTRA